MITAMITTKWRYLKYKGMGKKSTADPEVEQQTLVFEVQVEAPKWTQGYVLGNQRV